MAARRADDRRLHDHPERNGRRLVTVFVRALRVTGRSDAARNRSASRSRGAAERPQRLRESEIDGTRLQSCLGRNAGGDGSRGGGSAVGSSRSAHPTATAFRAKAGAICRTLDKYSPPTTGTLVTQVTAVRKRAEAGQAALARLRPPPGLARLHAQVVALGARDTRLFKRRVAQLRAGILPPAEFLRLVASGPSGLAEARLWRQMGVSACARSG